MGGCMFAKIQAWTSFLTFMFFQVAMWDSGEHHRHVAVVMLSFLVGATVRYTLQALHWTASRLALTVNRSG